MAAAPWESLANHHPFVDGTKRVGFAGAYTFLAMNGLRIEAEPEAIYEFIIGRLEAGSFDFDHLDAWLREHTSCG